MARQCELTGKKVLYGHKVSHSNIKTNRRFEPNVQNVSLYSEALKRFLTLRVTVSTIRSVDHNGGLDPFLVTAKARSLTPYGAKLRREIKKAIGEVPFTPKKRYESKSQRPSKKKAKAAKAS